MDIVISYISSAPPVTILRIIGEINATSYEHLQDQARQEIEHGTRYILLDLAEVPYIRSAAFRAIYYMFYALRTDATEDSDEAIRDGMQAGTYRSPHLKLARPTPRVEEVLKLAGTDQLLEIYDDLQTALASFQSEQLRLEP